MNEKICKEMSETLKFYRERALYMVYYYAEERPYDETSKMDLDQEDTLSRKSIEGDKKAYDAYKFTEQFEFESRMQFFATVAENKLEAIKRYLKLIARIDDIIDNLSVMKELSLFFKGDNQKDIDELLEQICYDCSEHRHYPTNAPAHAAWAATLNEDMQHVTKRIATALKYDLKRTSN